MTNRSTDEIDEVALLKEIEGFLKATGMAHSYLGLKAVNNGHLVSRLRTGGAVEASTASRLRQFMRHRMKDTSWWARYPDGRQKRAAR